MFTLNLHKVYQPTYLFSGKKVRWYLCKLCTHFWQTMQTNIKQSYYFRQMFIHGKLYWGRANIIVILSSGWVLMFLPWHRSNMAGLSFWNCFTSFSAASLCFDRSRSRKTSGSLADTLQCNIWRRAQTPHRMIHALHGSFNCGKNNGFTVSNFYCPRKKNRNLQVNWERHILC